MIKYNKISGSDRIEIGYGETVGEVIGQLIIKDKARGAIAYVNPEPFYNCQIASIGIFARILESGQERATEDLYSLWPIVSGKRMLIVDIGQYSSILEAMFNVGEIKFKQPYVSTNGSHMTIYLLNMERWMERTRRELVSKPKLKEILV